MKIYKKLKSIIFYMSIEEQKKEQKEVELEERECELELKKKNLEEREQKLKEKEEDFLDILYGIKNTVDSIYESFESFETNVSDHLIDIKSLLKQFESL